ncbi:hypothetical protein [uncultured Dysgonomonas sp.]|uniref:Uncharacterized protein n=1 Tax=uncultured Dysgonomonas sp. TaxID=206096 RepID=A0A212JG00_9BACT|nr:hypothetical protein [uncultured Dysgonomonas sp.]SBV98331.1 conserved hypothetical protein [uncultured Dysgonomonas sp.]
MRKISFAEKNSLVIRHKNKKFFFKDLELFNKHFPSHALINELARANEFSYDRLDGQMLYELLSIVEMKEILENRTEKEQVKLPESTGVKTLDDVKTLLIEQLGLTEEDIEQIGEDYLQFLTTKDDEDIKVAVQKFVAALRPAKEGENENDNDGDSTAGENSSGDGTGGKALDTPVKEEIPKTVPEVAKSVKTAKVEIPVKSMKVKTPAPADKKKEAKAKNSKK